MIDRAVGVLLEADSPPRRARPAPDVARPAPDVARPALDVVAPPPAQRARIEEDPRQCLKDTPIDDWMLTANRFDLVSALPADLLWVLSKYLNFKEMLNASLVSQQWMAMFGNDEIW